jgi:Rrf2 family transcriptional regulator, iron-sulfur cluster assembly transcription factor
MRMELSRKADYAIRAALTLARHGDARLMSTTAIAEAGAIPPPFARHVLSGLARAGLVASKEGAGGGYRLARPPAQVSLLDVIEAVEGPLHSTRCVVRGLACSPQNPCVVHPEWAAAQAAMRTSLASSSLAGMLDGDGPGA